MAVGYGRWLWLLVMAAGYGRWLWLLVMAVGYGRWRRLSARRRSAGGAPFLASGRARNPSCDPAPISGRLKNDLCWYGLFQRRPWRFHLLSVIFLAFLAISGIFGAFRGEISMAGAGKDSTEKG